MPIEMLNAQSQTSRSTSSSLLLRVRSFDADAWVRLTKIYGPEVYRWARQCGMRDADAADIVQDVFHAVARSIPRFRHDRTGDSFRGWLWRITRNKIRDRFRELDGFAEAEGGSDARRLLEQMRDPSLELSDSSGIQCHASGVVHRALELLREEFEPRTWRIFWRLAIEGHTAGEVAAEFGMQKSAVRQAKYRVMRRLRQELKDLEDVL